MIGPPRWVESYVGTPTVDKGFDRAGCHCYGLVWLVYHEQCRIELARNDALSAKQLLAAASAFKAASQLPPWHPVAGPRRDFDVVLIAAVSAYRDRLVRFESHVGIAIGRRWVLHVDATHTVCVPDTHYSIRHRIIGAFRHEALL